MTQDEKYMEMAKEHERDMELADSRRPEAYEPCCGFCFGVGLPSCSKMSGCWYAPQDRDQERVEAETILLALITYPASLKKET